MCSATRPVIDSGDTLDEARLEKNARRIRIPSCVF